MDMHIAESRRGDASLQIEYFGVAGRQVLVNFLDDAVDDDDIALSILSGYGIDDMRIFKQI